VSNSLAVDVSSAGIRLVVFRCSSVRDRRRSGGTLQEMHRLPVTDDPTPSADAARPYIAAAGAQMTLGGREVRLIRELRERA
jgi:hypothetical protein